MNKDSQNTQNADAAEESSETFYIPLPFLFSRNQASSDANSKIDEQKKIEQKKNEQKKIEQKKNEQKKNEQKKDNKNKKNEISHIYTDAASLISNMDLYVGDCIQQCLVYNDKTGKLENDPTFANARNSDDPRTRILAELSSVPDK
jgi:hypothetical protein